MMKKKKDDKDEDKKEGKKDSFPFRVLLFVPSFPSFPSFPLKSCFFFLVAATRMRMKKEEGKKETFQKREGENEREFLPISHESSVQRKRKREKIFLHTFVGVDVEGIENEEFVLHEEKRKRKRKKKDRDDENEDQRGKENERLKEVLNQKREMGNVVCFDHILHSSNADSLSHSLRISFVVCPCAR